MTAQSTSTTNIAMLYPDGMRFVIRARMAVRITPAQIVPEMVSSGFFNVVSPDFSN
jgi:hypothetical protein